MNKSIPDERDLRSYYLLGLSMHDIAKELKMSVGKVHKYFKIYKIEPRKSLTNDAIERIKNANKNNSYAKGKKRTEEQRKRISDAKLKKGVGHKKIRKDGYIAIYFPDHPKSNKDGYIMEHILVMECYIGRWLKDNEIVHHINKKRNDNRIENLKLMTKSEHMSMHAKERHEQRRRLLSTE